MVKLWQFLKKDISPEAIAGSIDTTEAILGLAEKLQDKGSQIQQLAPLINNIDSLLDVLNLPLVQVAGAGLPFIPIATGVLRFCLNATKHKPSLSESVILVTQVAYLESLKAILNLPVNQAILEQIGNYPGNQTIHQQLKKLGELEIDESEIEKILSLKFFNDSKIAQEFNQILMARLQQAGLEESNAKLLTERVSRNTYRYINKAFEAITNEEEIKSLARYNDRDRRELEKIYSLDDYLDTKIAPLPNETVFTEKFTYQQIYVPLKAQSVDENGKLKENAPQEILQEWVAKILQAGEKAERVIFIQGDPGRGKSVFCRMFADYVRQNFHPIWTPILIRLRDIVSFEKSIETTLRNAVKADFASSDDGWLSDRNTRYLFLLDGFDELRMEMRTERGIEEFLRKVGQFQQDCNNNSEYGHRVLITGRATALHGIFQPDNLERI